MTKIRWIIFGVAVVFLLLIAFLSGRSYQLWLIETGVVQVESEREMTMDELLYLVEIRGTAAANAIQARYTAEAELAECEAVVVEPTEVPDLLFCNQWKLEPEQVLVESYSDMAEISLFHANEARNLVNLCLKQGYDEWWPHATKHLNETIRSLSILHSWLVEDEAEESQ